MITKITDFKREIQDWMEREIREFQNPDPRVQKKRQLLVQRDKRKQKLKNYYGL